VQLARHAGASVTAVCSDANRGLVISLGADRAVRDRTYDLADVVEAHRYVDTGHKRGNVVLRLTCGPEPTTSSIEHHSREAAS
jgi:NADPH:quinone reductase-like Zn-dependent oxidoreductase